MLLGLSQSEQATLAAVAPGIAEALIATAMGLFAAIPAVLAYNHFTAKANFLYDSRALFSDEMTGMLQRETSATRANVNKEGECCSKTTNCQQPGARAMKRSPYRREKKCSMQK